MNNTKIDTNELVNFVNNRCKNNNDQKGVWMGFASYNNEYNTISINAKGGDRDVAKAFRDAFGGTAIAGSVKTVSNFMFRKGNGGFFINVELEIMAEIMELIVENDR